MRIIFAHAGAKLGDSFLKIQYYSDLVELDLKLVTKKRWDQLDTASKANLTPISASNLPTKCIMGMILFSDIVCFDENNYKMWNDKWCTGPFCYEIADYYCFDQPIDNIRGKCGFWKIPKKIQSDLANEYKYSKIMDKIKEWNEKYKTKLYKSGSLDEIRVITIQQPFISAIFLGLKTQENRDSNIGNVSLRSIEYVNHKHCRFCGNKKHQIDCSMIDNKESFYKCKCSDNAESNLKKCKRSKSKTQTKLQANSNVMKQVSDGMILNSYATGLDHDSSDDSDSEYVAL